MRQAAGVKLNRVHHIAIIAADHQASKRFYCDVLGRELLGEVYRTERDSWAVDLALNGGHLIELVITPGPCPRRRPEKQSIRADPHTGRAMRFLAHPDG